MDFFESQELARKKTKWLVFLFCVAVVAIIVAIFGVVVIAVSFAQQSTHPDQMSAIATDWRLIAAVIFGVLFVITIGTATKTLELQQGGAAVASLMGGRRIVGNAKELTDRKVANVVEEMALASGTPVPPVYILDDEEGINAFAAGYTVDDAVIGINLGTAEKLTREELQGVVAHEFSHILNGDMKMSLRMVAILNGILLISVLGGQLLNLLSHSARHSVRRSKDDNKGGGFIAVMYLIAIGLYLVGSIGLFFGRWIKSTISRQREYLADASAVQFTRIPDGIAGALKMIGGTSEAASMQSANAEQISHMFFGSFRSSFIFATHPPLMKRIHAIDDRFDGNYQKYMLERQSRFERVRAERIQREATEQSKGGKKKKFMDFLPGSDKFDALEKMRFPINPMILIAGIGIPTDEDVEFSGFMVDEIQPELLHALRETWSARCVVFASLLSNDDNIQSKQMAGLQQAEAKGTHETTLTMKSLYDNLQPHLRLGAFEIIQGTLSAMSPEQYPVFRKSVNELIVADQKVDLFEFFLYHHLIVHLDRCFNSAQPRDNRYKKLDALRPEINQILSILAQVGTTGADQQLATFAHALESLFPDADAKAGFVANWNHRALSQALSKLSKATPPLKKQILSAAVMAISHDNVLTIEEVELFRAMSESMDCPVPPLVATRRESPELPDPENMPDAG